MSLFTSVSIGIPCYNSASTIARVLEDCFAFLPTVAREDYEVFCLDDGSTDNTWSQLQELQRQYPKLRLERHGQNQGFGTTIGKVLMNTRMEVNAMLPADGQVLTDALKPMMAELDRVDLVLGHRKHRKDAVFRKFSSWIYNLLVSLAARHRIQDVNCAVAYRTKWMHGVTLHAKTAFIHAEFFIRMVRAGCTYRAIETPHHPRTDGKGAGGNPSVIKGTINELFLFMGGKLR